MTTEVPSDAEPSDVSTLASQLCEPDGESEALLIRLIESPESLDRLGEDRADSIMLKTLAWLHALDDESFKFGDIVLTFYRKHLDVLCGSPVFDEPEEVILERIQRTFIGIAQGIETTLPRQLRSSAVAVFRITWTEEDGAGAWDSDESETRISIPIRPLVFQAAEVFGELEESDRALLATAILEDLRAGVLSLPGFALGQTPGDKLPHAILSKKGKADQETVLRWKPPETEVVLKHLGTAREDIDPESIVRLREELRLWDSEPTAAVKVDSQTFSKYSWLLSASNKPAVTEGIVAKVDRILDCLDRSDTNAARTKLRELRVRLLVEPLPVQGRVIVSSSLRSRPKGEGRTAQSSKAAAIEGCSDVILDAEADPRS